MAIFSADSSEIRAAIKTQLHFRDLRSMNFGVFFKYLTSRYRRLYAGSKLGQIHVCILNRSSTIIMPNSLNWKAHSMLE